MDTTLLLCEACVKHLCDLMASTVIKVRRSLHRIWITCKKSLVERNGCICVNNAIIFNIMIYSVPSKQLWMTMVNEKFPSTRICSHYQVKQIRNRPISCVDFIFYIIIVPIMLLSLYLLEIRVWFKKKNCVYSRLHLNISEYQLLCYIILPLS